MTNLTEACYELNNAVQDSSEAQHHDIIHHLLSRYLIRRGFHDTAAALDRELNPSKGNHSSYSYYSLQLEQLLDQQASENDADRTPTHYEVSKRRCELLSHLHEQQSPTPEIFQVIMDVVSHQPLNEREKKVSVLVTMYQEFTSSQVLLDTLLSIYFSSSTVVDLRVSVLNLIQHWMQHFYLRFERFECAGVTTSSQLVEKLLKFVTVEIDHWRLQRNGSDVEHAEVLKPILEQIHRLITHGGLYRPMYRPSDLVTRLLERKETSHAAPKLWSLFAMNPQVIALHFTVLEFCKFALIQPQELLNSNWSKYRKLSPNLLRFNHRFIHISNWVASMIVTPAWIEERVSRVQFFITLAKELWDQNQFNAVQAILLAFRNNSVSRLHSTFSRVSQHHNAILNELQEYTNERGNYIKYRQALLAVHERMKGEERHTICCIPYLGIPLGDLMKMDEANSSTALLTISQMKFEIIERIMTFQHHTPEQNAPRFIEYLMDRHQSQLQPHIFAALESLEGRVSDRNELMAMSNSREASAPRLSSRSSSPAQS